MKLILASGSPRRRELLEALGLSFTVVVSDIVEERHENEKPEEYVARLSREKAFAVSRDHGDSWVVAADTVVVLDERILEKPRDENDAIEMLSALSGREHTVFTGVTLEYRATRYLDLRVATTAVRMLPLTREDIKWYAGTGEPYDKAGAYAVQGVGAMFIESIRGNYTNVVGLPLAVVFDMMRKAGIDPLDPAMRRQDVNS